MGCCLLPPTPRSAGSCGPTQRGSACRHRGSCKQALVGGMPADKCSEASDAPLGLRIHCLNSSVGKAAARGHALQHSQSALEDGCRSVGRPVEVADATSVVLYSGSSSKQSRRDQDNLSCSPHLHDSIAPGKVGRGLDSTADPRVLHVHPDSWDCISSSIGHARLVVTLCPYVLCIGQLPRLASKWSLFRDDRT